MRFGIREFKPEDFDVLHAIDQECFSPGIAYSRRELAYYIRRRGAFTLVAETGNPSRIGGFIVSQMNGKGLGHVITIDALAKYRRSGLGTQLMMEAEQRLLAAGCEAVFLEAAVDNRTALAFYKKLNYLVLKTIPRYYKNEVDAFLLVKQLAKSS